MPGRLPVASLLLLLVLGCRCGREPPAMPGAPSTASREAAPATSEGSEATAPSETAGPVAGPVPPETSAPAGSARAAAPWEPAPSDQQMQGVVLELLHVHACEAHPEDEPACRFPLGERPLLPEDREALARLGERMTSYLLEEHGRVRREGGDARPVLRLLAASGTQQAIAFLGRLLTGQGVREGGEEAPAWDAQGERDIDDAAHVLGELPPEQALLLAAGGYAASRASGAEGTLLTFVGVVEAAAQRGPDSRDPAVAWMRWLRDSEGTTEAVRMRAIAGLRCLEEGEDCAP